MALIRAQVVIPHVSGLPQDVVTNTFHFDNLSAFTFDLIIAGIRDALSDFYNAVYDGEGIAGYLQGPTAEVRFYDMTTPAPRVPTVLSLNFTEDSSITTQVPAEVSLVLSFQAEQVPGLDQARRRGRIYLPGLTNTWVVMPSAADIPRPNPTAIARVTAAASALLADSGTLNAAWVVYSQTGASSAAVTNGWVDNEFDTQRRRGGVATQRNVWT